MTVEVAQIAQVQFERDDEYIVVVEKLLLANEIIDALIRDMQTLDERVTTLEGFHP